MSNMKIIDIPAYLRDGAGQKGTARKLRVAAYCRVSTEEEEQQGSFEIQKLYYTEKINSTPEWEVAGIYADDGISGVHTKKRDGFNQMIQDCKKHRIDLILTKSISRFARNTLDSIQYVRMLKQMGIAVVFEKENINTATMNSEMILTVLSAFAQAESESISQNVARGKRMVYKHGKFAFPYGRIIGYRKGADGKPEIIPEQAEVIRLIFNSYLQGDSLQSIKTKLETAGALTARGNIAWSAQSIQRILQNEKYCGDVLLQKTFTEDVLTGVHKKNTGQLPQYYIENYHEGIVSKQMFREVQTEIARRNSKSAANQRKVTKGTHRTCVVRHIQAVVFVRLAQGKGILVFFQIRKILTVLCVQVVPCFTIVRALKRPFFSVTVSEFRNPHNITVNVIILGVGNLNLQVRGTCICFPKIGSRTVKSTEERQQVSITLLTEKNSSPQLGHLKSRGNVLSDEYSAPHELQIKSPDRGAAEISADSPS